MSSTLTATTDGLVEPGEPTPAQRRETRLLNDFMRRGAIGCRPPSGARYTITQGVQGLLAGMAKTRGYVTALAQLLGAVAAFDNFDRDNDPYTEHDFGAFEWAGDKLYWKIDCYDRTFTWGSDAPWNDLVTARVLTIMLASEY